MDTTGTVRPAITVVHLQFRVIGPVPTGYDMSIDLDGTTPDRRGGTGLGIAHHSYGQAEGHHEHEQKSQSDGLFFGHP